MRPPKKSWKNIQNLSGGEKTLSSLALVFALHTYKPTPLYVMDEIDAALDFKNVSIVANYIKEKTKDAQFIVISLRNNMFELADRLVGIYKTNNVTKSITIDPRKFAMPSGQQQQMALDAAAAAGSKGSSSGSASVLAAANNGKNSFSSSSASAAAAAAAASTAVGASKQQQQQQPQRQLQSQEHKQPDGEGDKEN